MGLLIYRPRQETSTAAIFQATTFTANINGRGVVQ
jgi:hypothetical protein